MIFHAAQLKLDFNFLVVDNGKTLLTHHLPKQTQKTAFWRQRLRDVADWLRHIPQAVFALPTLLSDFGDSAYFIS